MSEQTRGAHTATDHLSRDAASFLPNKNKFPPSLKPPLVRAAMLAMDKGEYNDNFFNFLPGIFPYNRFTMEKLVKREVCGPRVDKLEADIAATATALKALVDQQMPAMIQAYEANVMAWEAEVAEIQKGKGTSAAPGHESASMQPNESRQSLTPVGSDGDASMSAPPPASTAEGDALRELRTNKGLECASELMLIALSCHIDSSQTHKEVQIHRADAHVPVQHHDVERTHQRSQNSQGVSPCASQ